MSYQRAELPLKGVLVVALEQAVAAPLATRHLADLGARVIKVERRGSGDFARAYDETVLGQSSHFVWLNRGKESIELDLNDLDDHALLLRMLAGADVFLQNLAPGSAAGRGLGHEALRASNPGLICCDISGYGPVGPYEDKKAYDLMVQGESGVLSITGTADTPVKAGLPIADIAAGMYAMTGILTGLVSRARTGEGGHFSVSMLEALCEWMGYPLYYARYGGVMPARTGAEHATIAPYGPFETVDGELVCLGVQNDREWTAFCTKVLGAPELMADERFSTNARRVANRPELTAMVTSIMSGLSIDEAIALLDAAGIANARIRTPMTLREHPQLAARDRWQSFQTPGGLVEGLLPPIAWNDVPAEMGAVPAVGEHSESLRHEFAAARDHEPAT
ncbi:L-carnitine dehydratase/bile acid-inducible protein F [metagenome]|uniref:L-carnitine dehydratase/bile acid-inducible protein F n=1 Tax=metagenome TaxID=256318 RepID=A0A2P2C466_9ZZZZ